MVKGEDAECCNSLSLEIELEPRIVPCAAVCLLVMTVVYQVVSGLATRNFAPADRHVLLRTLDNLYPNLSYERTISPLLVGW
jgi:hypothetical protein